MQARHEASRCGRTLAYGQFDLRPKKVVDVLREMSYTY